MKTLVVGLGNPILTDDGVGIKVAQAVERSLPAALHTEVTVSEASVGGLRLMEMMVGYEHAIIIDALQSPVPAAPGTVQTLDLLDLQEMSPTQHIASAHDTTLMTALEMGRRMGLPLPDRVKIIAIEVTNVRDFNEACTPPVALAIPRAATAVLRELTNGDRIGQS